MTIHRRVRNKERCAYRGPKQHYNVWRAEYNQRWEIIYELIVRRVCSDHGLQLEDYLSPERRNRWEETWQTLSDAGYRMIGQSIRNMQALGEEEFARRKQELEVMKQGRV